MHARTHKDLDVWKKAIEFVTCIYKITEQFPKSEIYGLTSQMRRAAVSIPSNIAEGAARKHKTEFRQFLYIAMSSAAELETQVIIASNLVFLTNELQRELVDDLNVIAKMINGLIKSLSID